eukprot:1143328-Pelagomonas_calceolata.AAC.4
MNERDTSKLVTMPNATVVGGVVRVYACCLPGCLHSHLLTSRLLTCWLLPCNTALGPPSSCDPFDDLVPAQASM